LPVVLHAAPPDRRRSRFRGSSGYGGGQIITSPSGVGVVVRREGRAWDGFSIPAR
jgi:hypothetical protein